MPARPGSGETGAPSRSGVSRLSRKDQVAHLGHSKDLRLREPLVSLQLLISAVEV